MDISSSWAAQTDMVIGPPTHVKVEECMPDSGMRTCARATSIQDLTLTVDEDDDDEVTIGHSAASRAMAVPEVLVMALGYADKVSLAAASRVSGSWHTAARPYLWGELDSVLPLFALLAPMKFVLGSDSQRTWAFVRDPAEFQWDRFRHYSIHVKKLSFSASNPFRNKRRSTISEATVTSVIVGQPFGTVLLPNIKAFTCTVTPYDLFIATSFLSPTLSNLSLSLAPAIHHIEICKLFHNLARRTPELQLLKIMTACPAAPISESLADWIGRMPHLRVVDLPRFFHTTPINNALAKLGDLEVVVTNDAYPQVLTEEGSAFNSGPENFPNLRMLCLDMRPRRVARLFKRAPNLSQLMSITIRSVHVGARSNLQLLGEALSTCENLEHLALDFTGATVSPKFSNIQPFLKCRSVVSFELRQSQSLKLTAEDAVALGNAWPNLRKLSLCPEPAAQELETSPGTAIDVLPALAEHCPKLEELGLFFDKDVVPTFNGDLEPKAQFQRLQTMNIGRSRVPRKEWSDVGFYLASLCPRGMAFVCGSLEGEPHPDDADVSDDWQIVSNVFVSAGMAKLATRRAARAHEEWCSALVMSLCP